MILITIGIPLQFNERKLAIGQMVHFINRHLQSTKIFSLLLIIEIIWRRISLLYFRISSQHYDLMTGIWLSNRFDLSVSRYTSMDYVLAPIQNFH